MAAIRLKQKHWQLISRRIWGTVFTCVIAMAVCVQLGRQAFPLLQDYQEEITAYFSSRLGVEIDVEGLQATWSGMRPKLNLQRVHIKSLEGATVFKIKEATLELSVMSSLLEWRLAWRQLRFVGFDASVVQDESGRWSIRGMPAKEKNPEQEPFAIDDPYDVFVFGRRITIDDANFSLHYVSGNVSQLSLPQISIENDRDFHRIVANLDVDQQRAFSLLIEGNGDPRDDNFTANGYLELIQFPTQSVVEVLAIEGVSVPESGHTTDLKLWFRGEASRGISIRGEVDSVGAIQLDNAPFNLPASLSAQILGKVHPEKGWQLTFKDLIAQWGELASPATQTMFYGNFRGVEGLRIQEVDIQTWTDLAQQKLINNDRAKDVITRLNLRGLLKNFQLEFTDEASGYFNATATIEKGGSDAYKGAPAFTNINGYLSSNLNSGQFDIQVDDGLTIALPKVYHDPLKFEAAKGQIRWDVDIKEKLLRISSNRMTVTNPDEEGRGYLNLLLPFNKQVGEPIMTLAIGVQNTLAEHHKKYVPKTIPKHLYKWLGTSIKEGRVNNAKFLYHGSVEKNPAVRPTIQLSGEIHEGNLVFDPSWPELENVTGSLVLENNNLDVIIEKASLLGNSVYDAEIHLVKDSTIEGRALSIRGSLASDAETAMTLLKNSPVKQHIGSNFDNWKFSGGVSAKVELLIPLNSGSTGLAQNIDVTFSKARIEIPDLRLNVDDIGGKLYYRSDSGVFADTLSGKVWGESFETKIVSPINSTGERDTLMSFSGKVDIKDLYTWTMRPELRFAKGKTSTELSLFIPSQTNERVLELNANSTLAGVSINLPKPFAKTTEAGASFNSRIRFYENSEEYLFQLNDELRLTLLNTERSTSAKIEIQEFSESFPSSPLSVTESFEIYGRLDYFDLEQWGETKDQYFRYAEETGVFADDANEIRVNFNVAIEKYLLGSFEIDQLQVKGERGDGVWALTVDSEMMAGKVFVPEDDTPISLDLEYLRFAAIEEQEIGISGSRQSVLADIDLGRAVALDFKSQEFSLGAINYGDWQFSLRPIEDGVVIYDIYAETKGMRVGDALGGGKFVWLKTNESQSSQFTGTIHADNLADVFSAWGQEQLLASESASINIDARWQGAPDEVSIRSVQGLISLDIKKGSFNRGAGSDENGLLRLLALFNVDTILRRLRLDFSDLAAQGYAFDSIRGNLDFGEGIIYLSDPLVVESSSSVVQMAGIVDVINERIDSEMVVTLPLASSAAFATAMVVNLPAGLGLYLMSKLFKKQVDRASTINVDVGGRWEEPKIKVKKIFDINAATRRGREVKEKVKQNNLDTSSAP